MTKSRGIGRGGARVGAGRKRKPLSLTPRMVSEAQGWTAAANERENRLVRQLNRLGLLPFPIRELELQPVELARAHTAAAFETLAVIASDGASELAMVSAEKTILKHAVQAVGRQGRR